jgi:hypothetical protein
MKSLGEQFLEEFQPELSRPRGNYEQDLADFQRMQAWLDQWERQNMSIDADVVKVLGASEDEKQKILNGKWKGLLSDAHISAAVSNEKD